MNSNFSTKMIAKIAMLAAMAAVIMIFEFPVPGFLSFLKFDFSEIPVLVSTFAFGPLVGVFTELIKNLVHLPYTTNGGVGEFANFMVGCGFVIPAGIIYKLRRDRVGAILALGVGIVCMTVFASFANYFVMIPLYAKLMGMDAIIGLSQKTSTKIVDLKTIILYGIIPFNLFKGIVISGITFLVYKKASILINKEVGVIKSA